jgi:hypothetical protein
MEQGNEGDEILFFSYRQLGCEIPANIVKAGQVTAELLIEIIAKALLLISNGETKVATTLPQNIAVRHRICTDISIKIKDLGFLGECGYNQLLYPVDHQTRDLLKWLMEKIPRSADERTEELLGANALMNRNITKALQQWQKSLWKVHFCQSGKPLRNVYHRIPFSSSSSTSFASSLLNKHAQEKIRDARRTEEVNRKYLNSKSSGGNSANDEETLHGNALMQKVIASLKATEKKRGGAAGDNGANDDKTSSQLNLSLQELIGNITDAGEKGNTANDDNGRSTRFAHAAKFSQEAGETTGISSSMIGAASSSDERLGDISSRVEDAEFDAAASVAMTPQERKAQLEAEEQKRQVELQALKQEIQDIQEIVQGEEVKERDYLVQVDNLENELKKLQESTGELEKECLVRKRALELIPSAAENIAKLQAICDKGTERMTALQSEWDNVRGPLEDDIDIRERRKTNRLNKISSMIEEIKKYKDLMVPMVHDLKDKQERAQLLSAERAKLPKNLNRALYTHRIMDITASIAKQNKEIEKITSDIRDIQKTINQNSSTLHRSDAVTEELIFGSASDKNDPVMIDTYRRLKLMRGHFEALIQTVTNIGNTDKAVRDLETKVDQEQTRLASYNFERIQADLDAVAKENAQLLGQVKQLASK